MRKEYVMLAVLLVLGGLVGAVVLLALRGKEKGRPGGRRRAAAKKDHTSEELTAAACKTSNAPMNMPPPLLLAYLASVVNLLDADMRSCEIANWFVYRLAKQARRLTADTMLPCSDAVNAVFDIDEIVREVPRANEVTRKALNQALTKFAEVAVVQACDLMGYVTGATLVTSVEEASKYCANPCGTLLNLYRAKSPLPLPA
jgi:hypothetical protein